MYLIVGVDPGTTTGIAALNFRGDLINLSSSKDLGMGGVIEHLIKLGRVSLIASDVTPAPSFVSKLSAQLGAIVNTPNEPLSVADKIDLTRAYKPQNSHQRDALAAALITFNKFKNKFQKIDSLNLGDDVKHLVLQGHSIEAAVKMLEDREKPAAAEKPEPIKRIIPSEGEKRIIRLEKQNDLLRKEISEKKGKIQKLKEDISRIKNRYRLNMRKEREISDRDLIINSLEGSLKDLRDKLKEIDKLHSLWHMLPSGSIKLIGVFPDIYGGLTLAKRKIRKRDLEYLGDVEVVFSSEPLDYELLRRRGILAADTEYVREVSGCYYINSEDLKKIKSKKISLEEIVEDYRGHRFH